MDISDSFINSIENISITKEQEKELPKQLQKEKDCIELKNLEYKNVLMYGNNLKPKAESVNVSVLEELLEKESQLNKLDMWPKLDKTDKIIKLKSFGKKLVEKHKLNDEEEKQLNNYLLYCLERKYISKIKDVIYNRELGEIDSIPALYFSEENRTFYIKKNDKHGNTLKSLAPKKNRTQKF